MVHLRLADLEVREVREVDLREREREREGGERERCYLEVCEVREVDLCVRERERERERESVCVREKILEGVSGAAS